MKYIPLFLVNTTDTQGVIRSISKFIEDKRLADYIVSDRKKSFTVEKFKQFCFTRGIKYTLNSTLWLQANSQIERINCILLPILMISRTEQVT